MADIRIKVAKDKAKLVKALRAGDGATGPFQTYVDILIFSALVGLANKRFVPFEDYSKKDPDPIPGEHLYSKGKEQIISVISTCHTGDVKILSNSPEAELKRIQILESYANGGLEIIQDIMLYSSDNLSTILLFLAKHRNKDESVSENLIDLSFL
jgi:dnd system-associated protein 4